MSLARRVELVDDALHGGVVGTLSVLGPPALQQRQGQHREQLHVATRGKVTALHCTQHDLAPASDRSSTPARDMKTAGTRRSAVIGTGHPIRPTHGKLTKLREV